MTRVCRVLRPLALIVLLVSALAPLQHAAAQDAPPEVTVSIDRTRVTVGDPIQLTVTVKHPANVTVETTSIDDQLGSLEPLGSDPPEDRTVSGGMELRLRYRVAAFHTGPQQVPVITITFTQPDGSQGQVASKAPLDITVQSVIGVGADPTDIKPLKSQISLPAPPSTALVWAAGVAAIAVAVVLLVAGAVLLLRRRRRAVLLPAPSYAEAARAELDRIMALNLIEQGELVEHYRLLGACIRRYLTDRYGFQALALTTGELEQEMERRGVGRWAARLVVGLLSECDAVVYARYRPAATRCEADNAMAYEIVEETDRPVERTAQAV
jgi:hypothetical protein